MTRLFAALIVVAAAVAGALLVREAMQSRDAQADITTGAALYAEHCASCHGANLEGQSDWHRPNADGTYPAPPHDETGHTWHHDDAYLFDYTRLGGTAVLERMGLSDVPSAMPGFADQMTDDQIRAVLAYIASTWPDRVHAARKARLSGG